MASNEENDTQPLSRTKKKQLAKEVEKLADQLVTLPESQLAKLELSEEIDQEVEIARATRGRSSHRRQVKHLAGELRKRDAELLELLSALEGLDQVAYGERKQFHGLEELRDRLCNQEQFTEAFDELLTLCPRIDRKTIARLARSVHQHADRRASREIFRRLRDELSAQED